VPRQCAAPHAQRRAGEEEGHESENPLRAQQHGQTIS